MGLGCDASQHKARKLRKVPVPLLQWCGLTPDGGVVTATPDPRKQPHLQRPMMDSGVNGGGAQRLISLASILALALLVAHAAGERLHSDESSAWRQDTKALATLQPPE